MAGRGFGKTRCGSEWIRERVELHGARRLHLVGSTAADCRDTMVEGESGILNISPPYYRPRYEPSKRRLTWPNRRSAGGSDIAGAIATTFSAEEPDRLRGPQADCGWCDELASWAQSDAWDQLQFGLRLGADPRCVVTTTPRPTPIIRALIDDAATVVTRGSTFDNSANLAAAFISRVRQKYEGTRLGRQELHAEVLDDAPGALWHRDTLDACRVRQAPELRSIVVAIDPAVADPTRRRTEAERERLAETGIVVVGLAAKGDHLYVLEDASGHYTPLEWANRAIALYDKHRANYVIAESNQGGALVESNLRTVRNSLPVLLVHASRGKYTRAEPVASLYEQKRVHHVGYLHQLEDQMSTWEPALSADSPDRVDALVWGCTHLAVQYGISEESRVRPVYTINHDTAGLYGG